jgi:hypothetical protein
MPKRVGGRQSWTRLHVGALECVRRYCWLPALQATHTAAAIACGSLLRYATAAKWMNAHRPDFRTQQRLVGVWRAALCHVPWVCKGAAAACVFLLSLAGLHLPCAAPHSTTQHSMP